MRRDVVTLLLCCALFVIVPTAAAAPSADRILVQTDEPLPHSRPLVAGWRVVELADPIAYTTARARFGADVELDLPRFAPATDPLESQQWALRDPSLDMRFDGDGGAAVWSAWGRIAGVPLAPTIVAILDTGVDVGHEDLRDRLWTNTAEIAGNSIDDDRNGYIDDVHGINTSRRDGAIFDDPVDDSHGTHVAGIVAATAGNGVGGVGIAPNAQLMVVKMITRQPDGQLLGGPYDAIAGIAYAVRHGARVINISWGMMMSAPPQSLCDTISWAREQGVVVVAAAGNSGADLATTPFYPASCPAAFAVAASTSLEMRATWSSFGGPVRLAAPGEYILSTVPGGYDTMSGTSMAAPQVTGAAALLRGLGPQVAADAIESALVLGADRRSAYLGTSVDGRRLNVLGAVRVLLGESVSQELVDPRDMSPPTGSAVLEPLIGASLYGGDRMLIDLGYDDAAPLSYRAWLGGRRLDARTADAPATISEDMSLVQLRVPSNQRRGRQLLRVEICDAYNNCVTLRQPVRVASVWSRPVILQPPTINPQRGAAVLSWSAPMISKLHPRYRLTLWRGSRRIELTTTRPWIVLSDLVGTWRWRVVWSARGRSGASSGTGLVNIPNRGR